MPPPPGPPLAVACYHAQPDVVKALLASGADPLARGDRGDFPVIRLIQKAMTSGKPDYVTCFELLLATDQFELVAQMDRYYVVTPLVYLLSSLADNPGHHFTPT